MSPEQITALGSLVAAGTGLVTAVGVIVVALMNKYQGKKLEVVHQLVNSGMEEQLRIGMVSATTLANLTKSINDIALAEAAKKKYEAHILKA